MSDDDLDALYGELAPDFAAPQKKGGRSAREERIIAGFEDIQRFVETHGHTPLHGEDRDIFERLYAVRLDRLRTLDDCLALLMPIDHQGLLTSAVGAEATAIEAMDDEALLAELGDMGARSDITELRHVRTGAEKRAAEEIANRQVCADFVDFALLFEAVRVDLEKGHRVTRPFVKDSGFLKADIKAGQFFILGGQTAYVAAVDKPIKAPNGEVDARLRVIYSNGTESDLLLRSLQRALYKDEAGRRVTDLDAGPLFASDPDDGDEASGTIYVLRSRSDHPDVVEHRAVLHKIGVTNGSVERRIGNASIDPTFLMADVEIVATYKLFNVKCTKLEAIIHRLFKRARLDLAIKDRFGKLVTAREWFLVPRFVIDDAVAKIKDGSIVDYDYDLETAMLVRRDTDPLQAGL